MSKNYFSKTEIVLWSLSALLIILSFILFDNRNYLILISSLIGATSLIYNAKGNPFGQFLMIIFSVLYGIISFSFKYYGEMITYLGMTAPMALFSLIAWLKHPFKGNKSEVEINRISRIEAVFMSVLTLVVTLIFYCILDYFDTVNIIPSVLSVTTSFLAVYLTFRRSPFFALAYAANDIVLIILWILASIENTMYISVVICFISFLFNDIYGFINWRIIERKQLSAKKSSTASN